MIIFLFFISILLHELGHCIAALCCGVSVRKFCIFWDPGFHLFSTGKLFKTEICIGWLPLGGYVRFKDTDENGEITSDCIKGRPAWQQLFINSAGILVNLALAFYCIYSFSDKELNYYKQQYPTDVKIEYSIQNLTEASIMYGKVLAELFTFDDDKNYHDYRETLYSYRTRPIYDYFHSDEMRVRESDEEDMGYLNLTLFLFNMIPIPPLDGGKICINLYTIITRKEINEDAHAYINCLGGLIVIGFICYTWIYFIIELLIDLF